MSTIELRETLRAKYGSKPVDLATPVTKSTEERVEPERAFVVHAKSGRTVITAPLREVAMNNPESFTYLHGRFVEADNPNGNGAYWSSDDLELGQHTVAGGPLNWLHDERHIVGSLLDGRFVSGREAADQGVGNHIATTGAMWRFLFPREVQTVERAAADGGCYWSMECISRAVECLDLPGRPGCGEQFTYADYDAKRACAHLNGRSSARRFVDPVFQGGAVIIPPVRPGWSQANADVVRQAAELAELQHLDDDLSRAQAQDLAAMVLTWANRES